MASPTFEIPSVESAARDRYARQRLIPWWDQRRLAAARIIVVGAGAIGNEVLKLLALTGIGHTLVVDFDVIEVSNLARAVLFRDGDIGLGKAEVAARRTAELNPQCEVRSFHGDVEHDLGEGVFHEADLVLGCVDNLHARLVVNRLCQRAGIPFVNGGIADVTGEIALFVPGQGACFECLMTAGAWRHEMRRYSCGGLRNLAPQHHVPTTATIATVVASYMVNEALYWLHRHPDGGKGGLPPGSRLFLSLDPYLLQPLAIPVDPECLAHERLTALDRIDSGPGDVTARDIASRLGLAPDSDDWELLLPFEWLAALHCEACGRTEAVDAVLQRVTVERDLCPHCATPGREKTILHRLTGADPAARRPLAELGVPERGVVAARMPDRSTRYVVLGAPFWGV